jgi:hypothetical protein
VSFPRPEVDNYQYGYLPTSELEMKAEAFYFSNKCMIERMVRQIIDERYNPKQNKLKIEPEC